MAAGYDHVVDCAADLRHRDRRPSPTSRARRSRRAIEPGKPLRLMKFVAYGWSSLRSVPALRDQVAAALVEAVHAGWDDLARVPARVPRHLLGPGRRRDRGRGPPAAGAALRDVPRPSGRRAQRGPRDPREGPDRLGLRRPRVLGHRDLRAADAHLLDARRGARRARAGATRRSSKAKERAKQLGLEGAAFPVADDRRRGVLELLAGRHRRLPRQRRHRQRRRALLGRRPPTRTSRRSYGIELLVETARLWRSLGHHDADGAFRIDGVTGPDEYSRGRRQQHLHEPLRAEEPDRRRDRRRGLPRRSRASSASTTRRRAAWRDAAAAMTIPYDEALGVHQQSEDYTHHARVGLRSDAARRLSRCSCTTRTSTSTASRSSSSPTSCSRCTCAATPSPTEEKARNFAYYEPITVRDSSLSACTQAVIAAEVGHLDLAFDYMTEAALMDLDDLEHNAGDGIHMASLAGAWVAAVAGFGGMRDHWGKLSFTPRLPNQLTRLRFRLAVPPPGDRGGRHARGRHLLAARRANRSRSPTTARSSRSPTDKPIERSIPAIDPGPRPSSPRTAARSAPAESGRRAR